MGIFEDMLREARERQVLAPAQRWPRAPQRAPELPEIVRPPGTDGDQEHPEHQVVPGVDRTEAETPSLAVREPGSEEWEEHARPPQGWRPYGPPEQKMGDTRSRRDQDTRWTLAEPPPLVESEVTGKLSDVEVLPPGWDQEAPETGEEAIRYWFRSLVARYGGQDSRWFATHRNRQTAGRKALFLHLYALMGNPSVAARQMGVVHSAPYYWERSDPHFAALLEEARVLALRSVEGMLHTRAIEGVEEPVFHEGHVVGYRRKLSDVLLIFYLKSLDRAKYADLVDHRTLVMHSGNIKVEHTSDLQRLSNDDLAKLEEITRKAQQPTPQLTDEGPANQPG